MSIEPGFSKFDAEEYLDEYYRYVSPENHGLLKFWAESFTEEDNGKIMADIGGGPTLYSLITPAKYVSEIHFSDYSLANIIAVTNWIKSIDGSYNWNEFIRQALELEGLENPTDDDVNKRAALLRKKITKLQQCDITKKHPLKVLNAKKVRNTYDIVSSNFVAESITDTIDEWKELVENVASLVDPAKGSSLILSSLLEADFYKVDNVRNKAAYITRKEIFDLLRSLGFSRIVWKTIPADILDPNDPNFEGYRGLSIVRAFR